MKNKTIICFLLLLASWHLAAAQGTAFTYQGRLNDGTNPATGIYDLSFTLYNDATAGMVAGAVTNDGTTVTCSYFTVTLDFGPVFTGTNYWLEIAARTNGESTFTILSPRQPVMPVPYAIRAASAGSADVALMAASASSISSSNITGTIQDTQLSTNVALMNGSPKFAGTVSAGSFTGSGAGTGSWKISQNAGQSIKSHNNLSSYTVWTNRAVPFVQWNGVACSADGNTILGVSSSSGGGYNVPIAISSDGGITWRTNSFIQSYSAASSTDGSALYVGYYYAVAVSTNSGLSWASYSMPYSATVNCLATSADGSKVYAGLSGNYICYSPDFGADWFARNSGPSGYWTSLACSSDGSRVIGCLGSTVVFTSANYGATWTTRSVAFSAKYVACSSDGSKIIAAPSSGYIWTSSDYGATWIQQSSGSLNWSSVASSSDGTKLVATVNGGFIYTSTDSGITWMVQNSSSRNWSCVASSADGTKLVAGAGSSSGSGQIWTSQLVSATGSSTGTAGYLQGPPYSTIELLYLGGGIWTTLNLTGTAVAF